MDAECFVFSSIMWVFVVTVGYILYGIFKHIITNFILKTVFESTVFANEGKLIFDLDSRVTDQDLKILNLQKQLDCIKYINKKTKRTK